MSIYPPPSSYPAIFNPAVFVSDSSGSGLSTAEADATYAKLAGGQTIVGEETFTGGILTNTIAPSSGTQVTVDSDLLYAVGSIGTPFSVTATGDVQGATLIATTSSDLADATATSLTCGSASFSNRVIFNTPFITGTSWSSSTLSASTYTLTLTNSTLSVLSQANFQGQLYTFAKNGSTNSGMMNHFLVKSNGGTISVTAASTPPSNFTTLSLTATSSTLTVSTGTTASMISCLFIGAY